MRLKERKVDKLVSGKTDLRQISPIRAQLPAPQNPEEKKCDHRVEFWYEGHSGIVLAKTLDGVVNMEFAAQKAKVKAQVLEIIERERKLMLAWDPNTCPRPVSAGHYYDGLKTELERIKKRIEEL